MILIFMCDFCDWAIAIILGVDYTHPNYYYICSIKIYIKVMVLDTLYRNFILDRENIGVFLIYL